MMRGEFSEWIEWLRHEDLWLPPNITWHQVEVAGNYPKSFDLLYAIPLAFLITCVRLLVEKLFFIPIGTTAGLEARHLTPNLILEKAFSTKSTSPARVGELANELNWSEQEVRSWFRKKRRLDKKSVIRKFNESGWRCTFYALIFLYGLNCLRNKPWFWNMKENWTEGLSFVTPPEIWWYYMVELAFYLSLMVSQFVDVQRKDFWQMMLHHVVTIVLITVSWTLNCVRIGSLVMLCHDIADIPLETAKLFGYLKMKRCCDITFVVFLLVWSVSRLGIYPFVLLKSAWFDCAPILGPVPRYLLNFLLAVLLVLHVIWTWMILQIIKGFVIGKPRDVRSDSEDSSDTDAKKEN